MERTGVQFVVSECCRLFSCGTSKDGESFLVEWNASVGVVERTYQGLWKHSLGVVQFDTTKSRYLAAGDEFCIKFWDMDNTQILTMVDAEGCLPVSFLVTSGKFELDKAFCQIYCIGLFPSM